MSIGRDGQIRLVVFDLGRVLVRICNNWIHACATAGIERGEKEVGPADYQRLRNLVYQFEVQAIGFDEFSREAGRILGATSGQIATASAAFVVGLYDGVPELLDELSAAGVKTACLSNTNEHHWGLLADREHPAFFPLAKLDYQFASHLIRARKPGEEIYVHLEKETDLSGSSILFFDDMEENVRAAEKRGWEAEWIDAELNDPIRQIRKALAEHGVLKG